VVEARVLARLAGWQQFAALAVRVDPPAISTPDGPLHTILSACLEALAAQWGGHWFAWGDGLYGCALPGIDIDAAQTQAVGIQSDLAKTRVETVSIGISRFPLLDFDSAAALQNACKALDHAAFFGPAAIVVFDAVSLNISGDHFYQSGAYDDAVAEYRAALRLDAANGNVHNSLGVCLAQQGKSAEARTAFEEAHRIDPNEAMGIYNLGVLHLLEKNNAQALLCFRKALAVDNRTFDIPFQIGKLLIEEQAYPEALNLLQAAAALREGYAPVQTLIGRCLDCLGRREEAITAYSKAIKNNPNDAAALSALGILYDTRGENPEICLTFCRQSVAVAPENGVFRLHLARLYHKHNQLEDALAQYETAAELGCDARLQIDEIRDLLDAAEDDRQCCA